jgi:hypothetical protein
MKDACETRSPLWVVTQDPLLTSFVASLQRHHQQLLAESDRVHCLDLSVTQLEALRETFAAVIRRGEFRLHSLCSLLGNRFLKNFEISSVVIGEPYPGGERFTLLQKISESELFGLTDLDLGTRQLSKLRIRADEEPERWLKPNLVANFVEYQPLELDDAGIHRLTSRIKAEEEIWNKVVDEMFGIDTLLTRDKQLAHLSRYVKDIFGLKVIIGDWNKILAFQDELQNLAFSQEELDKLDIPVNPTTQRLEWLETKDYIQGAQQKKSGWKALKSVVRWWDSTFEIQVQPLRNYLQERERLTQESHASFKTRREEMRTALEERLPLYGFYRALLQWLFLKPDGQPPTHPNVEIKLN